jgi:hypothetical protein
VKSESTSPAKHSISCPFCKKEQQEYVAATTSVCRHCGEYFKLNAPEKKRARQRTRVERRSMPCYGCQAELHIPVDAISWQCQFCSTHLDVSDRVIDRESANRIQTYGNLTITETGHFTGSKAQVGSALVSGRASGRIVAHEILTIRGKTLFRAGASGGKLLVEKDSRITAEQLLEFKSAEIRGEVEARVILVEGELILHENAKVKASRIVFGSLTVEEGAMIRARCISRKTHRRQTQ